MRTHKDQILPLALLTGAALLLGGCGSGTGATTTAGRNTCPADQPVCRTTDPNQPNAPIYPSRFVGNQASSAELVFASPSVTRRMLASGQDEQSSWEFARSDAALNMRTDGPMLATNQWPEPERASLLYPRRIWIDTRANTLTYFPTASEAVGAWRWRSSSTSWGVSR